MQRGREVPQGRHEITCNALPNAYTCGVVGVFVFMCVLRSPLWDFFYHFFFLLIMMEKFGYGGEHRLVGSDHSGNNLTYFFFINK